MEQEPDDSMARFRNFYPELSDEEWEEAKQNLFAYFRIAEKAARDIVRKERREGDIHQREIERGAES